MSVCKTVDACPAGLTRTVHLTDLGSSAAPDSERQAPYSSVGQVSSHLKPCEDKA
jgi:hypothetical protein